ncbi:hypothetical protein Q9L58_006187 [Maublancomyces gigas]|uniref:Uncharacterized protein n=1 Tax=Discina gigas TaxID=1032678 RepID=A0ABR3GG57_9PEZI
MPTNKLQTVGRDEEGYDDDGGRTGREADEPEEDNVDDDDNNDGPTRGSWDEGSTYIYFIHMYCVGVRSTERGVSEAVWGRGNERDGWGNAKRVCESAVSKVMIGA